MKKLKIKINKKKVVKIMYAIEFDLKIDDLKKEYGEPYNKAYDEIRQELETLGFEWTQGSLYISTNEKNTLASVYFTDIVKDNS